MRVPAVVSLAWIVSTSACFGDPPPLGNGETDPECTAGTEGCACIDGACLDGLVCISQVCVDPDSTDGSMTSGGTTTAPTGMTSSVGDTTTDGSADTGASAEGSASGGSGGPGEVACDPLDDQCEDGFTCIGIEESILACIPTDTVGSATTGDPCTTADCMPGSYCAPANRFSNCLLGGIGCCTPFCDVFSDSCPMSWTCMSFFQQGPAPPGYEHVGYCAEVPA